MPGTVTENRHGTQINTLPLDGIAGATDSGKQGSRPPDKGRMSSGSDQRRIATDKALGEFTARWLNALRCLASTDKLQWKRTQESLGCFVDLPLDNLPRKLQRRIDTHFARINAILERYALQTWDDYQKISDADLARIEEVIKSLAAID